MTVTTATPSPTDLPVDAPAAVSAATATGAEHPLVEEDLLVEDVSIDGMCGVY